MHFTIGGLYKDRYTLALSFSLGGTMGLGPLAKYYLASIRLGGQEVIDDQVEISGDEPMEIRYEAHGGTVRGSVDGGFAAIVLEPAQSKSPLPPAKP